MIEKINSRLKYIDRLKGLAILAVIVGHLELFVLGQTSKSIFVEIVSSFHMPLFLFLSGIVISSIPSPRKYAVKLFRFLMPFFIVGGVYCLIKGYTIWDFMFSAPKKGYWYLFVLAIYYLLLLPFKLNRFEDVRKRGACDIFIAIFTYLVLHSFIALLSDNFKELVSAHFLIAFWPCFILGYLLKKNNMIDRIRHNNYLFVFCMVLYLVTFNIDFRQLFFLKYFFAIITFVGLFSARENKSSIIENELERFGKGSLDIYIFHYFLLLLLDLTAIGNIFKSIPGGLVLELFLLLVLSVVISYICVLFGNMIRKSILLDQIVYGTFAKNLFKEKTEIK